MSAKFALKILIAIVLVAGVTGQTAILAESADDPAPIKLPPRDTLPRGLDWRLYAIATNPRLIHKLDQFNNISNSEQYYGMLRNTLFAAVRVLPEIFSEMNKDKINTALALSGDRAVYFWLQEKDRDIIGLIPMRCNDPLPGDNLILWIICRQGFKSDYTGKWSEGNHSVENTNWIKEIIKSGIFIGIQDINIKIDEKGAKAVSHFPINRQYQNAMELKRQHAMEIMTTTNILQVKVALFSDWEKEDQHASNKFPIDVIVHGWPEVTLYNPNLDDQ